MGIDEMLLSKALEICKEAHSGQTDKAGLPYYLHPVRVAERCNTVSEKIVGLLHDTIEDTHITVEYLRNEGFPAYIVDAILAVTKRNGEDYDTFVARVKRNPIGRAVKIHDLEDNMDMSRLKVVSSVDICRQKKYEKAYRFLIED